MSNLAEESKRNQFYSDVYDAGPRMINTLHLDDSEHGEFQILTDADMELAPVVMFMGCDLINDTNFYVGGAEQVFQVVVADGERRREAERLFAEAKPEERAAIFEALAELTEPELHRLDDEAVGRHQGWGRGEQHPTVRDYVQAKAVEKEALAQKATQPPQQVQAKTVEKEAPAPTPPKAFSVPRRDDFGKEVARDRSVTKDRGMSR